MAEQPSQGMPDLLLYSNMIFHLDIFSILLDYKF